MNYSAPSWQPWLAQTNRDKLEQSQNEALRIVTGQHSTTPVEALRAEAGVVSYATTSKRLCAISHEKAHRMPTDHPCRLILDSNVRRRLMTFEAIQLSSSWQLTYPLNSTNDLSLISSHCHHGRQLPEAGM